MAVAAAAAAAGISAGGNLLGGLSHDIFGFVTNNSERALRKQLNEANNLNAANIVNVQELNRKAIADSTNSTNLGITNVQEKNKYAMAGMLNATNTGIAKLQSDTMLNTNALNNTTSSRNTDVTTDTQRYIADVNARTQIQLKQMAEQSLQRAGLPTYLAYVDPNSSMLERRVLRGTNVITSYKSAPEGLPSPYPAAPLVAT